MSERAPLSRQEFIELLRREGASRYHDAHRVHRLMHEGKLTRPQLQQWVLNRFYYQTRIPIKDAIILSKSEDAAFRRNWIRRIHDHDGDVEGEGGLALWLRLAEGVGLDREEVQSLRSVLPGVKFACDAYVTLVRERSLVEAVASSLTEFFAPDLMSKRIQAWGKPLPLGGFGHAGVLPIAGAARGARFARSDRVRRAARGDFRAPGAVRRRADPQDRNLVAPAGLRRGRVRPENRGATVTPGSAALELTSKPKLAAKAKLRLDQKTGKYILLYPEKGLLLNPTGAAILKRCDGEQSLAQIIGALVLEFQSEPAKVEVEVLAFVKGLLDRGLLQAEP